MCRALQPARRQHGSESAGREAWCGGKRADGEASSGGGGGRAWTVDLFDGGPWPDWLPWGYGFPCGLARECLRRLLPGRSQARVLDGRCGAGAAAAQAMLLGHEVWACEEHPFGLLATRARAAALEMDPRRLERLREAFLRFGARLSVRPPEPARRGLWPLQLRRQALAVADFVETWEEKDLEAADLLRLALAAALTEAAERSQPLRRTRPSLRARRRESGLIGLLAARLRRMVEELRRLQPKVAQRPPVIAHYFRQGFPAAQLPQGYFDFILLAPPARAGRLTGAIDLPLLDAALLPAGAESSALAAAPFAGGILQGVRCCLKRDGWAALWMPDPISSGEKERFRKEAVRHRLRLKSEPVGGLLLVRPL